ncbi:hypothetical protein D3C80_2106150 [compost metagenome]
MGSAIIKVKSAAAARLVPASIPPAMVEPEREKPGHRDRIWEIPIKKACLYVI